MKIIFATLFLCCSFVGPASASLLANNLSEPTAGPTGISTDSWRAQAFSTTASAFTVTDIAVLFNNPHNSPGVFSMFSPLCSPRRKPAYSPSPISLSR